MDVTSYLDRKLGALARHRTQYPIVPSMLPQSLLQSMLGTEFFRRTAADGQNAAMVRDVLAHFAGGQVIVGVTSTPFTWSPVPGETALLMHDYRTERGLRSRSSIALVMPLGVPIPASPSASRALLAAFAERGIDWHPERLVRRLDPGRMTAVLSDGDPDTLRARAGRGTERWATPWEAATLTVPM